MTFEEALQKFISEKGEKEEYIIYLANGALITAKISEIGSEYIRIAEKDSESLLPLSNILRIREYPKNEKGKKKAIF